MRPGQVPDRPRRRHAIEDGYLVMPPALHETGVVYQWTTNGGITTLPAETYRSLVRLHGETEQEVETAVDKGGKVPEGHRDRFIFLRALEMAHAGLTEDEILPSMVALGQNRCEPALTPEDVRPQVAGAVKRARVRPRAQKQLALEAERDLSTAIEAPPTERLSPAGRPGVASASGRSRLARSPRSRLVASGGCCRGSSRSGRRRYSRESAGLASQRSPASGSLDSPVASSGWTAAA